jgi:hypothetical protein
MALPLSRRNTPRHGRTYYAMAMAHVVAADMVQADAIIVVPLTQPAADEILDFTYVAAAKAMFVQLHERPQPTRTPQLLRMTLR